MRKVDRLNLATLRIEGDDAALTSAVATLGLEVDTRWQKGEARRRGGRHESSGLNATVADADHPKAMIQSVREFLAKCEEMHFSFAAAGLSAELAIGVSVGDPEQYFAFVEVPSDDLVALGSLGVSLSFAGYPTSDESNAE